MLPLGGLFGRVMSRANLTRNGGFNDDLKANPMGLMEPSKVNYIGIKLSYTWWAHVISEGCIIWVHIYRFICVYSTLPETKQRHPANWWLENDPYDCFLEAYLWQSVWASEFYVFFVRDTPPRSCHNGFAVLDQHLHPHCSGRQCSCLEDHPRTWFSGSDHPHF